MKKIILLFGLVWVLCAFVPPHEFYLSVTEIEYKEEKQSLQIITRVFTDDFEEVLRKRYNDSIRLLPNEEQGPVINSIEKYLHQKLRLKAGGEKLQLNYLGKEYDTDQVVLYIEVEQVPPFTEIDVSNTILTDLFDDQKNVVHIKRKGVTKSMLLQKGNTHQNLTFKD